MIAIHDGFQPIGQTVADGGWLGFMTGADRLALDTHPYLCFTTPNAHNLKTQASQVRFRVSFVFFFFSFSCVLSLTHRTLIS